MDAELEKAKRQIAINKMKRSDRIEAVGQYVAFITAKLAGIGGLGIGVFEILQPEVIATVGVAPGPLVGVGLALLTGPKVVNVLAKVLNGLG
jgi:hypothetical protein